MTSFKATVERIKVISHPNADRLEVAMVGEYCSIVGKGSFSTGDLVAYIPEASILPVWLQKELGVHGKLAGPKKDRVKAVRLRGVLSQGLVYPARDYWNVGDDVTEELQIKKWDPPIPASLAGEVFAGGLERTISYDIENYKRFPHSIPEGTEVVFTEKLHGTWCQLGVLPECLSTSEADILAITSKGLASKGLLMKDNDINAKNIYIRVAKSLDIVNKVKSVFDLEKVGPVFILGEVFGSGIQDLTYDANSSKDTTIGFQVFDIYVGMPRQGKYNDDIELSENCNKLGLNRVPILYRGPFTKQLMAKHTNGHETVSGKAKHIREGIVIRPRLEMFCPDLPGNRLQLKSVSEAYLIRKNGTEYT